MKNKEELISGKENEDEKIKNKRNWLASGVITILLIFIIIDLYILANIGLENIILPEFDFTENKIYSLSEETKTKIKDIKEEITITFINYQDTDPEVKLAEKYVALNNNIEIENINHIESRKDLIEKYSLNTSMKLIIISSGEKETTLTDWELYTIDYSTNEKIDTSEEAITNGIVDVTIKDKPKIYFMSNHVQYDIENYFYMLRDSLEKDANETEILDILKEGKIPEDCDTLVITTLAEDITPLEKDKILEYINKGGELLFLIGPNITGKNLNNFQEILNQYGITLEEGIIFEGSSSNMLNDYPDFIIEKLQNSSLTKKLNMNMSVCLADAASIKFNQEKQEELNVEFEELARTTNKAFLRTNILIKTTERTREDSEQEEFIIGGIINKKINDNNHSKLIIWGNELFGSDMQINLDDYDYYISELCNNEDVILNSIAYLNEREDTITIRKSYDRVTYTATRLEHNIIMIIIFIIPLLIIILGIIIWQVRRRKK